MGKIPWIDIFSLVVFIRVVYIALRSGILNEFVKLTGVFTASFFSLQYYSSFLGSVFGKAPFFFSKVWLNTISFCIIFLIFTFVFSLIRRVTALIFRREKYSLWERIAAVVLGALRALFLVSVFVFFFYPIPFLKTGVIKSTSFRIAKGIAPAVYINTYRVYEKINPLADINKEVEDYYEAGSDL